MVEEGKIILQNKPNIPLKDVPLSALQEQTINMLCSLNKEMILMSDSDQFRDWRGILSHTPLDIKFKDYVKTLTNHNYMETILYEWMTLKNSNIEQLAQALQQIDRYDIYEDILERFQEDAKINQHKSLKRVLERTNKGDFIITTLDRARNNRREKLIIYDAFLMYSERDEDLAELIKDTLEKYGMHICIKNDLLGGIAFEHEACMNLISKRCRKVIIVVSKNFLNSKPDIFISKYAQHIGIEQANRKIVPCLREECEIPSNLRILFHLKYYRNGRLFDFWKKLYEAVAYDASEIDLNDDDEFEYIPHEEYYKINVPKLEQKDTQQVQETARNSESTDSAIMTGQLQYNEILKLPDPPMESPNNTSILQSTKKKSKKPIKWLQKQFGKKQKQKAV